MKKKQLLLHVICTHDYITTITPRKVTDRRHSSHHYNIFHYYIIITLLSKVAVRQRETQDRMVSIVLDPGTVGHLMLEKAAMLSPDILITQA